MIPFSYYYPEQCAGIYVVDDLMHAAAEKGIASFLSVPSPTRNIPSDAKWERDEYKCNGLIHIHRFRMYGEGKNPFFRALRYFFCECVQLHYLLWEDYDVAFIDSTPPIQGLKLPIVKLFCHKPVIYNAQDLFPETLSGAGLARNGGFLWKVGMWISRITFRNSDRIIAISEDIKRGIVSRGVPEDKVVVVYNWVDTDSVHPVAKEENPLFEELGLSRDQFTVVYAGNLGHAQNIGIILDAAAGFRDVQFVIFGSGGLETEVRDRIAAENLSNVSLHPLQPLERVSEVYSLGDVCVVSCNPGFGGSALPSKTWSIMSSGRPVLASFDEGELQRILEHNDCGVFTHAGDICEFSDAIDRMSRHPRQCRQMGENARRFVLGNLTKETGTRKYLEVITSFE